MKAKINEVGEYEGENRVRWNNSDAVGGGDGQKDRQIETKRERKESVNEQLESNGKNGRSEREGGNRNSYIGR